jgi:hypothetical protein
MKLTYILKQILLEENKNADRCKRIADRKYDKPSAYKSGAIVRCRKGNIWKDIKEEQMSSQEIISKAKTYKIPYNSINQEIKNEWIDMWKEEYGNDLAKINSLVARHVLYRIAKDLVGGVEVIDFANESKKPTNHFQMNMYLGGIILWTSPFIYVDNNHKVIASRTKIKVLDEDYEDLAILKEDELTEAKKETLRTWFKRKGAPGKTGGWVDCNTCRDGKCKSCGRKEGEKRSKYPSCRPTPAQCKTKGKGKKWGKTK